MAEATTCKQVAVTTGMHLAIEPNRIYGWERMSDAEREAALLRWAKELMAFFRDHRSMDVNSVYVHKEVEQQCSHCGHQWEPAECDSGEGDPMYLGCAYCALPVE